ncbi:rhamnogalacturonan acetylesterase [Sphingomonas mollis]|uniref:Rhamnogalacturonan acetylesterase n=1 Tax=Sphingomonas mollis TaxID=2795726 RepID=A0ABS0XKG3_9SPHN|nr:rhamnogalacturonan acetylesterase [Sphingomonas sp. BT553]MBJ6120533.1 rhamnogalacturonan acetylesterase [Sphingomonas sp. BT553]
MPLIAARLIAIAMVAMIASPVVAQRFDLKTARPYDGASGFEPGQPRLFSVKVPEGNYRVTVTLGDPKHASETTIKAESRRLMLDAVAVPRSRSVTRSFVVNVRTAALPPPPANAPGGVAVRLNAREAGSFSWDDKLTLEILGDRAAATAVAIEPADVPTLYLLGDSTVTDQRFEPAASWGQMLPVFFGSGIAVANHAESGETLKSFVTELRLDKALSRVRPGDWAMIQFGHNDQKAQWPQTHAPAATTYRDWLRTYIAEFRRRGAVPILVTSPERRNWTGDRIKPTLADYAGAVRAVAAEEKVPLIDLNAASIAFYEALGPARAPLAFNDGGKDATHHDNYGAWGLARAVAEAVRTSGLPLAAMLAPGLTPFDPAHPPAPDTFRIAPSVVSSDQRPAGN